MNARGAHPQAVQSHKSSTFPTYLWGAVLLLWFFPWSVGAAPTHPVVQVIDSLNLTPIRHATVRSSLYPRSKITTDTRGIARWSKEGPAGENASPFLTLEVDHERYQPRSLSLPIGQLSDTVRVTMVPRPMVGHVVSIIGHRSKEYTTIDNPAVALVDALIAQRAASPQPEHTLRAYDKLNLSVANFDLNTRWLNRLFPFFRQYVTVSQLDQRWTLPLSLRETISDLGRHPSTPVPRENILYRTRVGIDQNIDDGTMTQSLDEIFPRVDLYAGEIPLLNHRFVSPLSPQAHRHYRYYLTDTLITHGEVVRHVQYYPRDPRAFAFQGHLYISMGDQPQLIRSSMEIPAVINLNFVKQLRIEQSYAPTPEGHWVVDEEEMYIHFGLFRKLLALYADHSRKYTQHNFHAPDTLLTRRDIEVRNLSSPATAPFYATEIARVPFLASDTGIKGFLEEVKKIPLYRALFDVAEMIGSDYIRTDYSSYKLYGGSKFDIGPLASMVGSNSIEGTRLRLGGRTTAYLSPYFFAAGYAAYGLGDKKWKYTLKGTLSAYPKRYFADEYPRHALTLAHSYDLYTPGQIYRNNDKDNLLHNLGTSYLTNRSYRRLTRAEYQLDLLSGLSLLLYGEHYTDWPTGSLSYVRLLKNNSHIQIPYMNNTAWGLQLRYTPGERRYDGSLISRRGPRAQRGMPTFTAQHESALRLFNGDFSYQRTEVGVEQRLWLSSWGHIDYNLKAGKIWSSIPFPLLYTPPANAAFAYNDHSFQLLQPMQYVGDEYATLFSACHLQGVILNHIPLVNQLRAREVVSLNLLYGNTSPLNRADLSPELFLLPNHTTQMHSTFHAEVGVGLENILSLFRIDLYRRLTPFSTTREWALKGSLKFAF